MENLYGKFNHTKHRNHPDSGLQKQSKVAQSGASGKDTRVYSRIRFYQSCFTRRESGNHRRAWACGGGA